MTEKTLKEISQVKRKNDIILQKILVDGARVKNQYNESAYKKREVSLSNYYKEEHIVYK